MFIFQGFPKVFTPLEASWVLSRAESWMQPAHDAALAAGVESCKEETCCHFIQPADMTGGWLRHILVPSELQCAHPCKSNFLRFIFILAPVHDCTCATLFTSSFFVLLQEDPSKTEMSAKMETALQFLTATDLKDLQDVEGKFSGESLLYEFISILFVILFCHLPFYQILMFCSYF